MKLTTPTVVPPHQFLQTRYIYLPFRNAWHFIIYEYNGSVFPFVHPHARNDFTTAERIFK